MMRSRHERWSSRVATEDQVRVYGFSKPRLFGLTSIGLFLPVTVWLAAGFAGRGHWPDTAFLGFISVGLAILDWWAWGRLLRSTPALILNGDVMIERASLFGAGRVGRDEVAGVRIERRGFFKMVVVEFHRGRTGGRSPAAMPAILLSQSAETIAYDISAWIREGLRY
jgi:hypothetical protein